MKFQEIMPDFLAGEKIRRKSWEPKSYFKLQSSKLFDEDGDEWVNIPTHFFEETDWEIYQEPKFVKKTAGQELYEINESVFCKSGVDWNERQGVYKERWEIVAQKFEPEVLRRYRESLPNIEGKDRGELCFELGRNVWNTNERWANLSETCKEDYAKLETAFLAAYQLTPPEPELNNVVNLLCESGTYRVL